MPDACENATTMKYRDLLPPLGTEERESLRASIEAEGVRDPVVKDEDGNVLDGHHRLEIKPDAPVRVVPGSGQWTDPEKRAYVYRTNFARRNLSPAQKDEVDRGRKETAVALAAQKVGEDYKYTQAQIGALVGAPQRTVANWLAPKVSQTRQTNGVIPGSHLATGNNPPSAGGKPPSGKARRSRVKVPYEDGPEIYRRWRAGESQTQIAADYGVNQSHIAKVCKKQREEEEKKRQREELEERGRRLVQDCGVVTGDFREVGVQVPDGAVDLIFTDPPYDRDSVDLYDGLASFAARVLKPGGSCIAYFGQHTLPEVVDAMRQHLRFWWTLAVIHTGQTKHLTGVKVIVTWKPLLWFVKETGNITRDLVMDSIRSEREKDAHDWQQGLPEALYYIEKLAPESGLVVDPFCGGGTTCLAAKQLGRRYLAFEKDETVAARARGRLAGQDSIP